MPRPRKSITDYINAGAKVGLKFVQPNVPRGVGEQAVWECVYCGRRMSKSYRALKATPTGCYCRSDKSFGPLDYHDLADSLGIEFLEEKVPPLNTKTKVIWRGPNGNEVEATYAQLSYKPSEHLLRELGVYDESE